MLKHEDAETREREVNLWLEKNEIPYERYVNLSLYNKDVLRKRVCTPTRNTSDAELKELYKQLCLPHIAGRESIDPLDFMPHEELEKFFSPLTPSETLHDLEKY